MNGVAGRVALVTGAGTGIGQGIARALANAGATVVLTGRNEATLAGAVADITSRGHRAHARVLDVTDRPAWAQLIAGVSAELGPVTILVNNAGVSTLGVPFADVTPELWDAVVDTNLTGVFNGVNACLGGMRAAGGGHIVNVSSMGGVLGIPKLAPYCASKFAVVGLSESLRRELAPEGIGVSVVCPGGVRSELWQTSRALRERLAVSTELDDGSAQSATASMMPDEVGADVIEAIFENELYVFTHPEFRGRLAQRADEIDAAIERTERRHPHRIKPAGVG